MIVPEVELRMPFSHFIEPLPQPTLVRTVFWVFAADFGSVSVDFLLRHDTIVTCVSSVKVPQKLLDISMRLLILKEFHFFTSQLAVYVMVGIALCSTVRAEATCLQSASFFVTRTNDDGFE